MMRASRRIFGGIGILLALFLIEGCRSNTRESGGAAADGAAVGVAAVGLDTCFSCHADGSLGKFPSMIGNKDVPNVGWLYSAHGNDEAVDQNFQPIDLGVYNDGFPYYAFSEWNDTCRTCHDPLADGKTISAIYALYGAEIGRVDRPVIGCETCHGAGGNHFGLGPIPTPRPDSGVCGQCHTDALPDDHLPFHPEGDRINEDYQASPHSRSVAVPTLAGGSATDVAARCSRCHTDEGVKLYVEGAPGTAAYSEIEAFFGDKPKPDVKNASPVQCRTCHDVHNQGKTLLAAAAAGPPARSEEFNTCTTCHQLLKADGTLLDQNYHAPYAQDGATAVNPDYGGADRMITDTHFDNPATPTRDSSGAAVAGTGGIEGYVVNPAGTHSGLSGNTNQGICLDCHNPHKADNTINRQWARSAHGGFILDIKEQAANVYTAAVTDTDAAGWVHYDFKGGTRQACQRCHTSTGFRNLANNPTTYNPATNAFIAASSQAELLYCWACHTDHAGGLRSPGRFVPPGYEAGTADVMNGSAVVTGAGTNWTTGNTPVGSAFSVQGEATAYIVQAVNSTTQVTLTGAYAGTTAAGVNYVITPYIVPTGRTITGLSGSFICANCHSGRETGEYIKNYPVAISGKNFGTFNSHYLAAAGVLYRTIGYEYGGLEYSNPANFAHDAIGVTEAGTNGPCVECHMTTSESHLFLPTARDATTGEITAITSNAVCDTCHGASLEAPAVTPTVLNDLETQYTAALEALKAQLAVGGIYWGSGYPYFFSDAGLTTAYTAWPNKDTLGAAFNYNMLEHMPMAFVHNSLYTRRLIFDSIDRLDNGSLDGDITATVNGLSLTDPQKADALAFLNGGARP